jgi:excisionase family DNA binding protein
MAYISTQEAADRVKVHSNTIKKWCKQGRVKAKKGKRERGAGYKWLVNEQSLDQITPKREVSCTWNGETYKSLTDAAAALGITREAMRQRVEKGQTQDSDLGKGNKHE